MATTERVAANSPAVLLARGDRVDGSAGVAKNLTATATVYVGGDASVDASTGYPWAVADGPFTFTLSDGETLYAFAAAPQQLAVLLGTE